MVKQFLNAHVPLSIALTGFLVVGALVALTLLSFSAAVYQIVLPANSTTTSTPLLFEYGSWSALSNQEFFTKTKEAFVAARSDFIEADLDAMKLFVYKKGIVEKEVPILSKGRVGSWWETPAGIYKVATKEKNHFSSFGKVYQPWSLAFQGNFFIHGWPYYPDGTPVAPGYSGGCIRLSNEDAEAVYKMVAVDTPVLIFERAFGHDEFIHRVKSPELLATQYLAADLKNNYVFVEKDLKTVVPVASLTKFVTALVAAEYMNLEKEIRVTKEMLVQTSKPRLRVGQTSTVFYLLSPLLLESSNEAAYALAMSFGEKRFVSLMNEKAKSLGMTATRFADPAGIDASNVSTAEDLFTLAKYLYHNRSFILQVSAGAVSYSVYGAPPFKDLRNFNTVEQDKGFIGGKVGETPEAKQTALLIFEIEFQGEKRPVVLIALGSTDQEKDVQAMRAYIETVY